MPGYGRDNILRKAATAAANKEVLKLTKGSKVTEKDLKFLRQFETKEEFQDAVNANSSNSQVRDIRRRLGGSGEVEIQNAQLGQLFDASKTLEKEDKKLCEITERISTFVETKQKSDNKDRLGLVRDRLEVEMDSMRVDVKEKKGILKDYNKNLKGIETNRDIDSKVLGYNQLLINLNLDRDEINTSISDDKNIIKKSNDGIEENQSLIKTIKKETEVLKIFEIYHKMIGKNGISKLVLSSVIPIINYELQRLLDEVCDFEIELSMNDKNEVEFLIIKSGVTKKLKSGSGLEATVSSLALRCVLGRISTLPKPNIIVFDEVLGKVADVNLDNVKLFFDKIKTMYDIILFITHNPIAQDWGDKIITVVKKDDISSLTLH